MLLRAVPQAPVSEVYELFALTSQGTLTSKTYQGASLELTTVERTRGLVSESTSAGRTTTTVRDIRGNTLSTETHDGRTTSFGYNLRNQVIEIDGPGTGDTITTSYGTNGHLQPQQMIDPSLGTVTYGYDTHGRRTSQTDGNGNVLRIAYNAATELPEAIRQNSATGPLVSEWSYDSQGKPEQTVHDNRMPDGSTNGQVVKDIAYDELHRIDAITWTIPGIDPQTISYDYRLLSGEVDTVTYPDGKISDLGYDGLERQDTYTYDGDLLGQSVAYNHDGQVTALSYGLVGTGAQVSIGYGYESWSGRIQNKVVNGTGSNLIQSLTYDWDTTGVLNSIRDTAAGAAGQWECFGYDNALRPTDGYTNTSESVERENRELRRANEILKAASSFFATELDGRRR